MKERNSRVGLDVMRVGNSRSYSDFLARMARDLLSTKSEDAIGRFNNAFREFAQSFQSRLPLDQVKKTYQLVALTQRIADISMSDN